MSKLGQSEGQSATETEPKKFKTMNDISASEVDGFLREYLYLPPEVWEFVPDWFGEVGARDFIECAKIYKELMVLIDLDLFQPTPQGQKEQLLTERQTEQPHPATDEERDTMRKAGLTDAEVRVVCLAAEGKSRKEIQDQCGGAAKSGIGLQLTMAVLKLKAAGCSIPNLPALKNLR